MTTKVLARVLRKSSKTLTVLNTASSQRMVRRDQEYTENRVLVHPSTRGILTVLNTGDTSVAASSILESTETLAPVRETAAVTRTVRSMGSTTPTGRCDPRDATDSFAPVTRSVPYTAGDLHWSERHQKTWARIVHVPQKTFKILSVWSMGSWHKSGEEDFVILETFVRVRRGVFLIRIVGSMAITSLMERSAEEELMGSSARVPRKEGRILSVLIMAFTLELSLQGRVYQWILTAPNTATTSLTSLAPRRSAHVLDQGKDSSPRAFSEDQQLLRIQTSTRGCARESAEYRPAASVSVRRSAADRFAAESG